MDFACVDTHHNFRRMCDHAKRAWAFVQRLRLLKALSVGVQATAVVVGGEYRRAARHLVRTGACVSVERIRLYVGVHAALHDVELSSALGT